MPRKSKADQDAGFMRSLWDELRVLNVDYDAVVNLTFYPSKRPGVFVFRIAAVPIDADDFEQIGTQAIQFEYPTVLLQSLPGSLFGNSMKLSAMYAEAAQKAAPRKKPRG